VHGGNPVRIVRRGPERESPGHEIQPVHEAERHHHHLGIAERDEEIAP